VSPPAELAACRGCGAEEPEVVLDLGEQPLANDLLRSPDEAAATYPLAVAFCAACGLAQLTVSVDPSVLFDHYAYFSSFSPSVGESARRHVERLVRERSLGGDDLVVEIASNDGYLLRHYVAAGVPVLGIDPARNVAAEATASGIPTIARFFSAELAEELRADGRRAAVLHANNVLGHVPDVNGLLTGVARVLADDGVAIIETPSLRELVEHLEYDTIYHEHVYYHSVVGMDVLLRRNGLRLLDVEDIPLHGGSLRLTAGLAGASATPRPSVERALASERAAGLDGLGFFRDFGTRVDALRERQREVLTGLVAEGRRVAAYGAAAKATVLLNATGIDGGTIDFVADRSPHKQGRYVPGVRIPIVGPEALLEQQPDDVLLCAWNFAEEVLEQQAEFRRRGGRFVLPVPEVRFVDPPG
jgi:SAM-dependent methyltransferase